MSNKDFDEKDLMKDIDELDQTAESKKDTVALDHEDQDTVSLDKTTVSSGLSDADPSALTASKAKSKKVFTTKQVVLLVVIAVLAVLAIGTVVICSVANVNPVAYIAGEMSKDKLVNKWQSQTAPGLSAYEFFDDGTYTSYLSTYSFDGEYEVEGDKLILKNPNSNQNVIYKYSIVGDTLTLTLTDSNGTEMDGREPNKFDRVDSFNQKSIQDIIDEYRASAAEEESQTAESTSAESTSAAQ